MVTSKATLQKIKEIISKHYNKLAIGMLGASAFTPEEIQRMKDAGLDVSNEESFLELTYNHNYLNNIEAANSPTSVEEMQAQQSQKELLPKGEAHSYTIENQTDKTKELLDKMKADVNSRVQGIIRENNDKFKSNALQNLDREDHVDQLIKESSLGKVKQQLRDLAGITNRNFSTIATTEISNVIGIASVDRVVVQNRDKDLEDVFVYRISVQDSKLCKFCREFYLATDGTPKLYKLSTLLGNGSNYGRKSQEWQPVVGATHPNERCSQIIELKPGFQLLPGGSQTYVGLDAWNDYVFEKLED